MLPPKSYSQTAEQKSRLPPSISRLPAAGFATRVLIVDPDRQLGVTLSFMLATRRYEEVRSVRSAGRALAIAEQFLPEIIFLDLDLLEGGGITMARLLTRDTHGHRPRLIALTKYSDDPNCGKTRPAGFERLVVKPVSHEELDKILGIGKTAA